MSIVDKIQSAISEFGGKQGQALEDAIVNRITNNPAVQHLDQNDIQGPVRNQAVPAQNNEMGVC